MMDWGQNASWAAAVKLIPPPNAASGNIRQGLFICPHPLLHQYNKWLLRRS